MRRLAALAVAGLLAQPAAALADGINLDQLSQDLDSIPDDVPEAPAPADEPVPADEQDDAADPFEPAATPVPPPAAAVATPAPVATPEATPVATVVAAPVATVVAPVTPPPAPPAAAPTPAPAPAAATRRQRAKPRPNGRPKVKRDVVVVRKVQAPTPQIVPAVQAPVRIVGVDYTVRAGDTLSAIAARLGTTWQRLYELNRATVADPDLIYPGQRLRIG